MAAVKSIIFLAFPLSFCTSSIIFLHCNAATEATINKICEATQDFDFCSKTLHSDPRYRSADLHGLALISISLTSTLVGNTLDRIPEILKGITDKVGKQRLGACKSDFEGTLGKLRDAFRSIDNRAYEDGLNFFIDGSDLVSDCQTIYPHNDSPLLSECEQVDKLLPITLNIICKIQPSLEDCQSHG